MCTLSRINSSSAAASIVYWSVNGLPIKTAVHAGFMKGLAVLWCISFFLLPWFLYKYPAPLQSSLPYMTRTSDRECGRAHVRCLTVLIRWWVRKHKRWYIIKKQKGNPNSQSCLDSFRWHSLPWFSELHKLPAFAC